MQDELGRYFRCCHVSNDGWEDPRAFDHVLYHVGASRRHRCVFRALQVRPGTAIIHEHNCLSYYYEAWDELGPDERREFLGHAARRYGRRFDSLCSLQAFLDQQGQPDRYAADARIEALFMRRVSTAVTHSPYVARLLRQRYAGARVRTVPFMAAPLDAEAGRRARQALGVGDGDFLFGSFGFIGEYKRIEKVLAAWDSWPGRPPSARLLLVGERQYAIELPRSPDVIWLDYLDGDAEFDAYMAAVDCGIQLRHPTLGETSAVLSRFVANGRPVITSATPFTSPYQRYGNVLQVRPDDGEIRSLAAAYERIVHLPRTPPRYRPAHSPDEYVRRVAACIRLPAPAGARR